jgi:hypothetical protein
MKDQGEGPVRYDREKKESVFVREAGDEGGEGGKGASLCEVVERRSGSDVRHGDDTEQSVRRSSKFCLVEGKGKNEIGKPDLSRDGNPALAI